MSIVVPKFSYKMICSFIPGLTLYRFTSARLYAATTDIGVVIEPMTCTMQRFDDAQVGHFVNFMISPLACTELPFGEKIIELTDDSALYVLDSISNQISSHIIPRYYRY